MKDRGIAPSLSEALVILNSGDIPRYCSPEEFLYISECFKKHPRATRKIGCGIKNILIKKAIYKSRGFFIERTDSSIENFSIYKCFRPSMSKSSYKFRKAARMAAQIQLQKDVHLHHTPPWTFEKIVQDFIDSNHIEVENVIYEDSDFGVEFMDEELRGCFKEFHDSRACLIPLDPIKHHAYHSTDRVPKTCSS